MAGSKVRAAMDPRQPIEDRDGWWERLYSRLPTYLDDDDDGKRVGRNVALTLMLVNLALIVWIVAFGGPSEAALIVVCLFLLAWVVGEVTGNRLRGF